MKVARLSWLCFCPEALPPFTQSAAARDFWALCAYTTRLIYIRTSLRWPSPHRHANHQPHNEESGAARQE